MKIEETFARLRGLYPEDIETLEAQEKQVARLLEEQEYYSLPMTQELLKLCRRDVVTARMKLATIRDLDEKARAELWHIIEAREWFLRMVAKDYESELAQIESSLAAEIER